MRYENPEAGEWVYPKKIYRMACCDCGLVHKIEFGRVNGVGSGVKFRVWRDNRSTGQVRRHMKGEKK